MKCVLNKKEGTIDRVADARAAELVKAGTHSYASKQDWKKQKKAEGGK